MTVEQRDAQGGGPGGQKLLAEGKPDQGRAQCCPPGGLMLLQGDAGLAQEQGYLLP